MQTTNWGNASGIITSHSERSHHAWSHGTFMGEFKTLAAARAACTRGHKQWVREWNTDYGPHTRSSLRQ
jgi:hypothetical protein